MQGDIAKETFKPNRWNSYIENLIYSNYMLITIFFLTIEIVLVKNPFTSQTDGDWFIEEEAKDSPCCFLWITFKVRISILIAFNSDAHTHENTNILYVCM